MQIIEHIEVGAGGATSVTFNSAGVFANYTDLMMLCSTRTDRASAGNFIDVYLNGDTTAGNYTNRTIEGNGASVQTESRTEDYELFLSLGTSMTANVFGNAWLYFPNINSSEYKSISTDSVTENNGTTSYQLLVAGIWSSTSAVTSIELKPLSGNFVQYSSFTLVGIRAGSDGTTAVS